jgi:hypothetical protein
MSKFRSKLAAAGRHVHASWPLSPTAPLRGHLPEAESGRSYPRFTWLDTTERSYTPESPRDRVSSQY